MPRVRSENPLNAQLLVDAPAMSATFRGLVAAIDATNGVVYVQSGRCGQAPRRASPTVSNSQDPIASYASYSARAEIERD